MSTALLEREKIEETTDSIIKRNQAVQRAAYNSRIKENYNKLLFADSKELTESLEKNFAEEKTAEKPKKNILFDNEAFNQNILKSNETLAPSNATTIIHTIKEKNTMEEEEENLRPTLATIQYKTAESLIKEETKPEERVVENNIENKVELPENKVELPENKVELPENKVEIKNKSSFSYSLSKQAKILIAVFASVVVMALTFIIVNTTVLNVLSKNISSTQAVIASMEENKSNVLNNIMQQTSEENIISFATENGMIK